MKKAIAALLLCVVLLALGIIIVTHNLPAVLSHLLARSTGIAVKIERADMSLSDGAVGLTLGNMQFKGVISGKVGTVAARMWFSRGIFLDRLTVKDFDVVVGKVEMDRGNFSTSIGLLEVSNGTVTVGGRKLVIGSIVAENINTKKPLRFVASITDPDHAGKVRVVGDSAVDRGKRRVKGSVEVDAFGLEKIDPILGGVVNGKGEFTFYEEALTLSGTCNSPKLTIRDTWLKKPLVVSRVTAKSTITTKGPDIHISVYDTKYGDAPFTIDVSMKSILFSRLDITSGPIPMSAVREYLNMDEAGYDVWAYVRDGSLKIRKLTYEKKKPFLTELELKGVTGEYEGKKLTDVSGVLEMMDNRGTLSDGKGFFKASAFHDVKGTMEFGKKHRIQLTGKYVIDLQHVGEFVDMRDVVVHKGAAEGTVEVDSGKGKDALKLAGSGRIKGAELSWRGQSFTVDGPFKLAGREMIFDPLVVTGRETHLTMQGRWGPEGFVTSLKGYVDPGLPGRIAGKTVRASGKALVDAHVTVADGQIGANGNVNMDDVVFAVPGFIRKTKGVQSRAAVRFTRKRTGEIVVDDLSGNLDTINLRASGKISDGGRIDSRVTLRAKDTGRAASLFSLGEDVRGGEVSIDLTVNDLRFPVTKLPWVVGSASMKKGFMKVPGIPKVLSNIDLTAGFRGHEFDVTVSGVKTGESVLRMASLKVTGFERPKFDLVVSMDRLSTADFRSGKEFRLESLPGDGVLARSSGNLSLRAKEVGFGSVPARDLEVKAFMTDRKINVSDLKLRVFGGETDVKGMLDLSGRVPSLYTNGRMTRVRAGLFMDAMGGTSQEISGDAFITGTLKTEGTTMKELKANLGGDTAVYSRDGVIKRWKLLSKIFALLNVYDLVRGKIDFGKDGLAYNKAGASFTINKGIYHTSNFLLDSPSMVITGTGDIDINKETIAGTLEVSPLVALDRTIDKIPVLRSILKNKNKGFLYVTYNISGSFDDPDISTNYVGTVGTKSLEILKNILVFPREVFETK
ncbi:MAG: putative assembly protein [Syntrophorhabdus sp. PtaB.Bin184]|jgi:hypothetical protein|nr:MAG: putative assembly protein [Syntrophorhabdus sp. PtaB.Bin184]